METGRNIYTMSYYYLICLYTADSAAVYNIYTYYDIISKYRQQVEATGARFETLIIGTTGLITESSMKLLEVLCGKHSIRIIHCKSILRF